MPTPNSSEDAVDSGDVVWYDIIISNTNQFQLVAKYLANVMLFHQVTQVVVDTKDLLVIGSIGLCSEEIVSRYACFICVMNLQCTVELLQKF